MPLKEQFLLDPEIIYLNHGSFGACPRPVFEVYQKWQLELERQPTEFLSRRIQHKMQQARQSLAEFLGVGAQDVVYFTNSTTAINMVARSIKLRPHDEILATNHEYGAMDRTWRFITNQTGARYINHPIKLPLGHPHHFVDQFWEAVTDNTKAIFISHITSPTSLILPIKEICTRARQEGILTIVDGAHAPGHIALSLQDIGADIYTGALHKWLCAPKGAAFLYAQSDLQKRLEPLVVSWGYQSEQPSGSQFIDYHEWQGTRDMSAFLSVPAAIEFQRANSWEKIRDDCHALATYTLRRFTELTNINPISNSTDAYHWYGQMITIPLPDLDGNDLRQWLYHSHRIEVPVIRHDSRWFLRVSFQAYNSREDADSLIQATAIYLQNHT